MSGTEKGRTLLHLARDAIAGEFGMPTHEQPGADWLQEYGATFVTLNLHERLRGCIGSLDAHRPLFEDVRANAIAAAFRDPRFAPLSRNELAEVVIEVSLLGKSEKICFANEQDALQQLKPDVDGVVLEYGYHRATFLPQVWEQLPDPHAFVGQLKTKAGLAEDFWSEDIKLSRYSVQKLREDGQDGCSDRP